jgi:4-hydroxy-3-methylbut-2-enyl diphosphate reductase
MEILVAKSAGFCYGVKRAINMARECANLRKEEIHTLGPIIHNPQVVKELERSHIVPKMGLEEINSGIVVIRSHGVTLQETEMIQDKELEILDATCPFVKKSQEIVALLSREGYSVIVVGEKEHPEVRGILSYGKGDIIIAASIDELRDMPMKKKIGIVAQTTQQIENLQEIVNYCLKKSTELRVFNTICNATTIRQSESYELAKEVDCIVVVGGRNSANTNRLAEMCRKIQPHTYHVEVASELDPAWFDAVSKVSVTGGASTPDWLIDEVVSFIKAIGEKTGDHADVKQS